MKKRIAVLGGTGMLGFTVFRYLKNNPNFEVTVFSRSPERLSRYEDGKWLNKKIGDSYQIFDYTINCIGLIKQKIDEQDNSQILSAIELNSITPYKLAKQHRFGTIINIATDCVFSGSLGGYNEASKHDALDVYGKTKSLGEVNREKWFNIRTSIIGHELDNGSKSLLGWYLNNTNNVVPGYQNHFWSGITTLEFAKICERIISQELTIPNVIHLESEVVSKFGLLSTISTIYGLNKIVDPVDAPLFIDRTLTTLYLEINKQLFGEKKPSIKNMIKELFEYEQSQN